MIWYAGYGSNLNQKRFLCYIQGGHIEGCSYKYAPMDDPTPPLLDIPYIIHGHSLSFSGDSQTWGGGGVAYLNPEQKSNEKTYSRLYLIKKKQFSELLGRENRLDQIPTINWDSLFTTKRYLISQGSYNLVMYLGTHMNLPIVTLTASTLGDLNPPALPYLRTIIQGYVEVYFDKRFLKDQGYDECLQILHKAVIGQYSPDYLKGLFELCEQQHVEETKNGREDLFRVAPTTIRNNTRRDFIVQLRADIIRQLGFKEGEMVLLAVGRNEYRSNRQRKYEVPARLLKHPEKLDAYIACMDEKLRAAIGARIGDWVTVESLKRTGPIKRSSLVDRLVGTQSMLMRVYKASYQDMEIPVCRIQRSVFEVIGAEPGDFINIMSPTMLVRVRALDLTSDMWDQRVEGISKGAYLNPREELLLDRPGKGVKDLPPIFIDYDLREKLKISPCSPVRIFRDCRDSFVSRITIIAIPLTLSVVGLGVTLISQVVENRNTLIALVCLLGLISILIPSFLLLFEIRNKIK